MRIGTDYKPLYFFGHTQENNQDNANRKRKRGKSARLTADLEPDWLLKQHIRSDR